MRDFFGALNVSPAAADDDDSQPLTSSRGQAIVLDDFGMMRTSSLYDMLVIYLLSPADTFLAILSLAPRAFAMQDLMPGRRRGRRRRSESVHCCFCIAIIAAEALSRRAFVLRPLSAPTATQAFLIRPRAPRRGSRSLDYDFTQ